MTFNSAHKRWLVSLFSLIALTVATSANADGLKQFPTKYYIIHSDLEAKDLKPLAVHMDAVFNEYKRRFSKAGLTGNKKRGKENLYLLSTREKYNQMLGKFGIDASNSGGMFFYNGNEGGLATWVLDKSRKNTIDTLQHEGFHQFAHSYIGGDLPVWTNEGLAVYFEQAKLIKGKYKTGIAEPYRIASVRKAIDDDYLFKIEDLINITSKQWSANMGHPIRGSLQYNQSWSLCHFLIHGNKGKYQRAFNGYLSMIAKGTDSNKAFAKAFGTSNYDALAKKWEEYVLEELEPDPYSVIIDEIQFLASAAQFLREREVELPDTLDGFKTKLQDIGFNMTVGEGGHKIEASSGDLYLYTNTKKEEVPYDYELDEKTGLPILKATGVKPGVSIEWAKIDGQYFYELKYR